MTNAYRSWLSLTATWTRKSSLPETTNMPASAQTNRVYDGYLAELAHTKPEDLAVSAVSIIGPRSKVSKLVQNLSLLR